MRKNLKKNIHPKFASVFDALWLLNIKYSARFDDLMSITSILNLLNLD